ncbi:tetratricopeptide repeat protein [Halalkalibacter urbisdiaboli]|uniref:tetratricopeptide repeat protein n=1 Tax=Halalkalibacter urbisdiaboli TaxID=1960589 RepID=UPI000B44D28D|nr:tetratricopeptide repeat protein [Halalkalibacter urbisdiaboli]
MDGTHQTQKDKRTTVVPFFRSGDYFFHRGIVAYRKNHLQRAVKLFERAVKLTNQEPVFHIQLAAVLSELGEYERSNEILSTILQEQGDEQSECYFFMANNYAYLGLFEKAENAVIRYLKLCPEDGFSDDARDLLELLQFERSEIDGWEDYESESDELIIEHEKARTLLRNGDVKAAIPILESVIQSHPTCWAAHNHLAEAYYREGKDEAFAICEHILNEDKGNLFAICNLAMFFTAQGDTKQAEPFVSALRQVYPLDVDHHVKVAQVLCTVGDYQQTVERMKMLETYMFDQRPELLLCYGIALYQLGYVEKANGYWRRASGLGYRIAQQLLEESTVGTLSKSNLKYDIWR